MLEMEIEELWQLMMKQSHMEEVDSSRKNDQPELETD